MLKLYVGGLCVNETGAAQLKTVAPFLVRVAVTLVSTPDVNLSLLMPALTLVVEVLDPCLKVRLPEPVEKSTTQT
jgi:hypothetical protein